MPMEAPEPRLQTRWPRPLQMPEPKLQRRWPTPGQVTAPHETGQYPQHNTWPGPIQTIEQLEDKRNLPKRENRVWKVIVVAAFALVLAVSTGWWSVTAVMP